MTIRYDVLNCVSNKVQFTAHIDCGFNHEIMSNQRAAVMRLRALRENRKPMPIKTKPVIVKIVKQAAGRQFPE